MSRLTSRAPFNRPSAFDVLTPARPAPLSPPETEMEPGPAPPHDENDSASPDNQHGRSDSPMARFRTVAYKSSSLSHRESKSSPRQSRWLVMVVPPASLTREPPVLGHTLSSAPAGRFSNGILMPLFPTLYGQLTAIAREFNMPSTTGVCIYLQVSDGSASMMTPRISDESWQLLWGHFFTGDERAAPLPSHGLPISGRIEFDIDLRRARWFNSWMGHPVRERGELEAMSREPSMVPTHWRGDSRTSLFPTEQGGDETHSPPDGNPPVTALSSRTAMQRHLPRPLLLERRDTASVRSFSRHQSRAPSITHEFQSPEAPNQTVIAPPPVERAFTPKALSPVVQEQEEPQTAKKVNLETFVHQWRQSSSLAGAANTALAAAGQPSLDPVNMPSGADVELDLNDFAWSISSAGPPSESPLSATWPEPLPSVHLVGRLQGSVCLTPSTCTSFGPLDYDWPDSPVSCVSRRPSPDLGMRVLDYVPLTPSTATSWGPDDLTSPMPSEYYSEYQAPSVDVGARGMGSRPVTPSTATSWGPDDLPSPMSGEYYLEYRAPSIDLGVRGMGSRPVTPSTATSWGPGESPLFMPPTPYRVRTPDAGERAFPDLELRRQESHALVFPYYSAWDAQPWSNVWPYQAHLRRDSQTIDLSMPVPRTRSKLVLPEWPDFSALYPSNPTMERAGANKSQPVDLPRPAGYPYIELYPTVYPYNLEEIYPISQAKAQPSKGRSEGEIQRWGHVWPYNISRAQSSGSLHVVAPAATRAPTKDLLPEWHDFATLYPSDPIIEQAAADKSQPVCLPRQSGYPSFNLYPTAYPYNLDEIYPASLAARPSPRVTTSTSAAASAPSKGLLPEWPDFASLYPADPRAERAGENKSQPVDLSRQAEYPSFDLYPAAYPYNLDDIYPASAAARCSLDVNTHAYTAVSALSKGSLPEWPDFASLYPADPKTERAAANKSQSVALPGPVGYPFLELYPTVYPYSLEQIYPVRAATPKHESHRDQIMRSPAPVRSLSGKDLLPEWPDFTSLYPTDPKVERAAANRSQPVTLPRDGGYPSLIIYAAVYPHSLADIYPPSHSVAPLGSSQTLARPLHNAVTSIHRQLLPKFPDFAGLYPSDSKAERVGANRSQPVRLPALGYPFLSIYSPVYPFNLAEIYGPIPQSEVIPGVHLNEGISVRLPVYPGYPTFNLYPASSGFPTFEIYPPIVLSESSGMSIPSVKLNPVYPAIELYEPVYPHLVIYPETQLNVAEEILPSRPTSPRKRAPTPAPGRHRLRDSSPALPNGNDQNTLRRLSRSPVQKELVPPLPVSIAVPVEVPGEHTSTPRRLKRTHRDLHRTVFDDNSNPQLSVESRQPPHARRLPKRTHHELHMMVFGDLSREDSQGIDDFLPELPSRSAPRPTPARQRSRSGTVSNRSSLPPAPPPGLPGGPRYPLPALPNSPSTGRSRQPSISTTVNQLAPSASPSPVNPRTAPLPPPSATSPLAVRKRSPSVSGSPPPPGAPGSVLNRVRSMNTPRRSDAATRVASESRGLDRSRSMSDAQRGTGNRQSVVLERAKMFTVSEQGYEATDVLTDFPAPPTSRPVSKLDRSKLPFA